VPLPAPEWLGAYAREEWTRIAKELHCLRLLTAFDVMSLAAYCEAYSTWRRAGAMLEEQAAADPETGALTVTTRHGAVMQNPLVQTMRQAAADMVRYASEFGFTPASRSKISVIGARPGPGKFDGLLAD
jgi:P27 family predicted phage terminase small subunit